MRTTITAITAIVFAMIVVAGTAHAQTGCTVTVQGQSIVVAGCTVVTATPTATRTPVRTATPTRTPTVAPATATATRIPPTATATATALPPTATATPIPPTATNTPPPTAPPVQASGAMTVNVPLLLDAVSGDARLDANNAATVWAGHVSPAGGYTQLRAMGRGDGLMLYVQALTPKAGGTFTVEVNGIPIPGTLNATDGWLYGGTGIGSRGWGAWRLVPWSTLGGMPKASDVWPLTLTAVDGDTWQGVIRWGAPPVVGTLDGARVLSVPVTADATLGGSTDCGSDDWPAYFPTWGSRSYEADAKYSTFSSVQNQWDTTDWPCYSRYIAKWALPQLPAGAQVTGAWLDVYYFGTAYPGPNDAQDYSPHQLTQAYQVSPAWDAAGVTWDNAPPPLENLSYTSLDWCDTGVNCYGWRSLDVTAAVQRAYAGGQPDAAVLLYTAAGQYHSGRYFYTREGGAPPVVRIAYTLPGVTPTWTPTPTTAATATPTASSTPTIPPTATPSLQPTATATPRPATATSTPTATVTATPRPSTPLPPPSTATATSTRQPSPTPEPTIPIQPATGRTYYVSPTGLDSNSGLSVVAPWRTFAKAWQVLGPGDTLLVMDGTYTETIVPRVEGAPGRPITIKALNDGKATIDAQGKGYALQLGDVWPGPMDSWYVVEGLVFRNGYEATVSVDGDHITLRRVSAYDASTDQNSSVVAVKWSQNVLLEDMLIAGTARKELLLFTDTGVTVRRVYTKWTRWDGRVFCNAGWPAGNGVNPYSSDYITVENTIAEGPVADAAFGITNQADPPSATNTNPDIAFGIGFYGSIALNAGMNEDGTVHVYPWVQAGNNCDPGPTPPPQPREARDYGVRIGFRALGQGTITGATWRDVYSYGAAQLCWGVVRPYGTGLVNSTVDHITCRDNARDPGGMHIAELYSATKGKQLAADSGATITNAYSPADGLTGAGARLTNRYVDGVLTDVPLWPWPMDDRSLAELGYSITDRMRPHVQFRNYP